MKRQAEEPSGIRDRNVERLSTASEDCTWYLGRRPELGCCPLKLEFEVRNPKDLLQSLYLKKGEDRTISWTHIQKDTSKLNNLEGHGMKVVGMPDVRASKWTLWLGERYQRLKWSAIALETPGTWSARISKSKTADKNQISRRKRCMPEVRERPEFRAKTLFSLSQEIISRWPRSAVPKALKPP